MIERNMGQVVPFCLSASKLRKSAYEHRRRGRPVEAVELLRRAALQEDTPAGWLHLAEELRRLGCYEQAATLLYRLLARADVPIQVWMELARCQAALGKQDAAVDSLYHYLHEDPYSDIADEARGMLSTLDEEETQDAFRLPPLIRRGLTAWRNGRRELGQRRLMRAVRMARKPARLYITLALLYMAEGEFDQAVHVLSAALRCEPGNARAACMRCVALNARGQRRMALGLLKQAEKLCDTAEGEDLFLTTAWTLSAHETRKAFLLARHRQQPCRIVLMHHLADLCWTQNDNDQAVAWWHRILRLDPDDVRARAMLRWSSMPQEQLPPAGTLPQAEAKIMLQSLMEADAQKLSPETMLRPGSDSRIAIDWCFTVSSEGIQQTGMELLASQDTPAIRQYLRELLVSPTVLHSVRQKVMLHLAQQGETGPMHVLMGQRVSTAECTPMPQGKQHLWKTFLPRLLEETRRHRQSEAIVAFAAELWPMLSNRHRHDTAGMDSYLWVKAVEVLYLRLTEQDEDAAKAVKDMPVSMRKVSRVLRKIARQMDIEPDDKE
ncbi:MAG: tetratricopeptide repeat protein [Clostridia bacterium]|nr:tetratricopeptide repeat protein [Clostridia bacterium]